MSIQRQCNSLTFVLLISLVLAVGYGYLSLQEYSVTNLRQEDAIANLQSRESTLMKQLKVVYHHSSMLEKELRKERGDHKQTLEDFHLKKRSFQTNISRTKHEGWTRFSALDSDYKMLKAKHEEMKIGYLGLQAQYRRLSNDHYKLAKESRLSYEEIKNSKQSESIGLQDRIQELYRKNTYFEQLADQNEEYYKQMKGYFEKCENLSDEYKSSLVSYRDQLKRLHEHQGFIHSDLQEPANVNSTLLENKLADLRKNTSKFMNQKLIHRTKLKNLTGVTEKDFIKDKIHKRTDDKKKNYVIGQTTNGTDDKYVVATPKVLQTRNFIIEQKDRFLRGKQKQRQADSNIRQGASDQKINNELPDVKTNLFERPRTSTNKINIGMDKSNTINKGGVMLLPSTSPIAKNNSSKTTSLKSSDNKHKNINILAKESRVKKSVKLVKPLQPDVVEERMDVNKVTLEEDEKGDQNLDDDTMNGNGEEPSNVEEGFQEHIIDMN